MAKSPSVKMRKRIFCVVGIILVICFLTLIVRLFYLQVIDSEFYRQGAVNQQLRDDVVNAKRGTIYDRNMVPLAKSGTVYTVSLSPVDIESDEDRELIAQGLSDILGVDKEKVLEKSRTKTQYEIIKRKVEKAECEQITQYCLDHNNLKGIHMTEDTKRYYPQNSLASTVIGFTGTDNQGLAGIESYYDKVLAGTPGRVVSAKNAWGKDMPFKYEKLYEAQNGNSLVLTLDEKVQGFVEKHLEVAVKEHKVKSKAAAIIMNVNSGEILAMATKPDFDLNAPMEIADPDLKAAIEAMADGDEKKQALGQAQSSQWRNKAVSDLYEPGSVFKVITAAAALEEKKVTPEDRFNCTGHYVLNSSTTYGCHKLTGHGSQSFSDGIMNSCNPVFIEVGLRLGPDLFNKYFQAFGLSEKTGIDLPGEATSIWHNNGYTITDLASSSFGQSQKLTPIEVLSAVSAAINGGNLYQPHVVKEIIDENGNIVESIEPKVKRQVVSENVSEQLRTMLQRVITEGGGKNAYVAGYKLGGKSGTSQKLDSGDSSARIASFMAFAPADDPQIAILVICDEPTAGEFYGSIVSAPIVGSILADTLPYLGIDPIYDENEMEKLDVYVPSVVNQKPLEAGSTLRKRGLDSTLIGNGDTVIKQIPEAGKPVPKGGKVILYTEEVEKQVTVPKLTGLTGEQVKQVATNAELNIRFTGSTLSGSKVISVKQDPAQDTKVAAGTVVTVEMRTKDATD